MKRTGLRRFAAIFGLFLAVLTSRVEAGVNQWTEVPAGGATSIALDPFSPATLYTAGYSGIFRSLDRGETWSQVTAGFGGWIAQVAVDPTDPSILYAASDSRSQFANGPADGIFRSVDWGATWSRLYAPSTTGMSTARIVTLSVSTSGIFAGVQTRECAYDFCYRFSGYLLRSGDGESWLRDRGEIRPVGFAVDPDFPSTIYAATMPMSTLFYGETAGGLIKSSDEGRTWTSVNRGIETRRVLAVALDPVDPARVFAGTMDQGLWMSADGAESWSRVLDATGVRAIAIDPVDRSIVYAGTDAGVRRTIDGGRHWSDVPGLTGGVTQLLLDPADRHRLFAVSGGRVYEMTFAIAPCRPGPTTLCLGDGRIGVKVGWSRSDGSLAEAGVRAGTADTGYFWFFDPSNVELAVKVVDGRAVNGRMWVFAGGLTGVAYTVTVTDAGTGEERIYDHPSGEPSSFADTSMFPRSSASSAQPVVGSAVSPVSRESFAGAVEGCAAAPDRLCLNGGRFAVDVTWQTPAGQRGEGRAGTLTADTGTFWFFGPTNVELVVKVLDGRAVNGQFWVFSGALSNVAYTITVTDTQTGLVKTYENPQGNLASFADTEAF